MGKRGDGIMWVWRGELIGTVGRCSLIILWSLSCTVRSANHFVLDGDQIVQKVTPGHGLDAFEAFETEYDILDGIKNRAKLRMFEEPPVAVVFEEYGGVDKALDYLRRATREEPDNPNHFNDLGNLWRVKGDTPLAVDCFRKCLSIDPRNTDALLNLAVALVNTGYPHDAERLLRTALELRPASVLHHFQLGNALVARGLPDAAAKSFRRALGLQPDFILAQNRLIELIALGWLPPVETNGSAAIPSLEDSEHKNGLPMDPVQLVRTAEDQLEAQSKPSHTESKSWFDSLQSSLASHWLPIVTTVALVLTVMVMVAPLLDPAEQQDHDCSKESLSSSSNSSKVSRGRVSKASYRAASRR